MKEPFFSVIVPVYNGEKFVCDAVESVLSQDYRDFEIIVVDDGSTDNSNDKLKKFGSKIKLIKKQHGGTPSGARNYGMCFAKGEMVAYLDHDDLWKKEKLDIIAKAVNRFEKCDFFFSDFCRSEVDINKFYALSNSQIFSFIYNEIRGQFYEFQKEFFIEKEKMFELLLKTYPVYPSTMVVRSRLFKEIGQWNENLLIKGNEDFEMNLRSSLKSDFCYIDRCLVTVRRHGKNLSSNNISQREGDIRVIEHLIENIKLTDKQKKILLYYKGKRLCGLGHNYLTIGLKHKAKKKYRQAAMYSGWKSHAMIRYLACLFRL